MKRYYKKCYLQKYVHVCFKMKELYSLCKNAQKMDQGMSNSHSMKYKEYVQCMGIIIQKMCIQTHISTVFRALSSRLF